MPVPLLPLAVHEDSANDTAAALGPDGALARAHPGFVARPGQQALAVAIGEAIGRHESLAAEAGTGTGKTYAYLVPALASGARVLISTGTRTLQDQLFTRDLPRVRDALGSGARIALLKGRANYVCLHHLQRNLVDGRFARRQDIVDLRRIELFARVTRSGDRAELSGVAEDAPAWALGTSTRDNCLGQECPQLAQCFVYKARQQAQDADVVVVNHHLFCADLALRDEGIAELLPNASAVIFDEAHQLPEVATQFFGVAVSTRQLVELGRETLRTGHADAPDHADWVALVGGLEQAIRELRLAAGSPGRLDETALRDRRALLDAVDACLAQVRLIGEVLQAAAPRGRDVGRCALRAAELVQRLVDWLEGVRNPAAASAASPAAAGPAAGSPAAVSPTLASPAVTGATSNNTLLPVLPDGRILWADVSPAGLTLHSTPLSVAHAFARHRDQRPRAWIFLSATLAVGGSLDFFCRSLGLTDARQMIVPSPFDFATQALLYVPRGVGDPGGSDYAPRLLDAVWPLIEANRGRAFVLCTTLRMVDRIGELLQARAAERTPDLSVMRQGQGTRAELLERFRAHPAPVLVGSASFWEGVDVPGEQLSLVIIDKLPFAPPDDPVLRARSDALRRAGHDPFRRLHLPNAAMVLKQGAGRLIRSEADRGVLVVGDMRLAERPYGRSMLSSLPPFKRTRELDEALGFITKT